MEGKERGEEGRERGEGKVGEGGEDDSWSLGRIDVPGLGDRCPLVPSPS